MEELVKELYEEWEVVSYGLAEADFIRFVRDSHRALVESARLGGVIFYGELPAFDEIKERFGNNVAKIIGFILDACSEYEVTRGRPLISAVVVNQGTREPDGGFYGLSTAPYYLCQDVWERPGKRPPEIVISKRQEFWLSELQQTLDFWGKCDTEDLREEDTGDGVI